MALLVLAFAYAGLGATLPVGPSETYATIQVGVDAARPGDTAIVSEGICTTELPSVTATSG
jgi:hypothetical protein